MSFDIFAEADVRRTSEGEFFDPNKDYYSELVGPGLKYADDAAFRRSKVEGDIYIKRLEAENKAVRDELTTRIKYEDFLDRIEGLDNQPPVKPEQKTSSAPPVTDLKQIEQMLEAKITQRDAENTAKQNLAIVQHKVIEKLGPNYAQHITQQATELGMSEQYLRQLAAANPRAFFKLVGIEDKGITEDNRFTTPPKTQSTLISTQPGGRKGDSYYEEIRKTKPDEYWSPKIQNEIFSRIKEIGAEDFYKT